MAQCPQLDRRTLRFLLAVATRKCFPDNKLVGGHALGHAHDASHYTLEGLPLSDEQLATVQAEMASLIAADQAIDEIRLAWSEARKALEDNNLDYSVALIESRVDAEVVTSQCAGYVSLRLHPLHRSAGLLAGKHFHLQDVEGHPGFVLCFTEEYTSQPTLLAIQQEHRQFGVSTGVKCLGQLNKFLGDNRDRKDYILNAEFRQERKISQIISAVEARRSDPATRVRLISIAGPTSSGKTTFATKLSLYLKNDGFMSRLLSVDHYYLPLDEQPKFIESNGNREAVDYDSIEAMDIPLVNKQMAEILEGQEVMTPNYSFKTGMRIEPGHKFRLPESKLGDSYESILVIEGIHALNPNYLQAVPPGNVFKIYICPQTVMQLDDHTCFKASDQRLLRRMSRDYLFRAHSASRTLAMWPNVRRGEQRWIFPHQNDVDFQMNSGMEYELPVLKTHVEPLLRGVTPDDPHFLKAQQLLNVLSLVSAWPDTDVPGTSLLREFIGQGLFDCH
jgi:uridine kinase